MNAAELKSEIAHLHRLMNGWLIEGRLDWDTEADMKAEIADLEEALSDLEHPEPALISEAQIERSQAKLAAILGEVA